MHYKFLIIITLLFLPGIVSFSQDTTEVFTVSQNPFPNTTELTIHNLSQDTVTLEVFNTAGQVVNSFFTDLIMSGDITVQFGSGQSDGIYLARLELNDSTYIQKLYKGSVSSLNEKDGIDPLNIFPNPSSNLINFQTDLLITSAELYDLEGRLIMNIPPNKKSFSLSGIPAGSYLLKLSTADRIFIRKIGKTN